LDGVSLRPVLLEGKSLGQRKFFWKGQAHREGTWKFVAGNKGGLFNLTDDLDESMNLAKLHPLRAKRMAAALESWKRDVATGATPQPDHAAVNRNR
ncbi:MAG: N-acetylgalactosamine-6-sulfate sulfatase, partial [Verrucomicrobiota bacterium]|nr:N-acetylgalactosamine-6-sulfate sulfatase [Verrucomicrobiota bacterium]